MMKYSTYTWDLVLAFELVHPLPPAKHQLHLLIPSAQSTRKIEKNPEIRLNSQQVILYYLGLYTKNPGLREVDLESSPERGSDKITMLEQGRST